MFKLRKTINRRILSVKPFTLNQGTQYRFDLKRKGLNEGHGFAIWFGKIHNSSQEVGCSSNYKIGFAAVTEFKVCCSTPISKNFPLFYEFSYQKKNSRSMKEQKTLIFFGQSPFVRTELPVGDEDNWFLLPIQICVRDFDGVSVTKSLLIQVIFKSN